ncbi:MAG: nitroreductase family protein [Desulfomonile tiedjei]|uniref:Nitroreductase family protein n=1 Tax=Desulfomonile tiedjei TaxID=2358 RepID=A0A9D6Z3I0_9BACT|nr:nitroreductase family protein [Desulfomonile tiedjei]
MSQEYRAAIDDIVARRRSIRKYKNDPVPKNLVLKVVEAARLAPSASNRQPWRFYIVDDEISKERLRQSQGVKQPFVLEAPVCVVCCADMSVYSTAETESAIKGLVDSGDLDPNGLDGYWAWWNQVAQGPDLARLAFLDVGIAVEHMALAATAYGLGTCWMRRIDPEAIAKALSLPKDYAVIAPYWQWVFPRKSRNRGLTNR